MKNSTIISDPGIDDLVALRLLCTLSSGPRHCLISSFGNTAEAITAKNAKEFISFVANQWYFKRGAKAPLNGKIEYSWPDYFHGKDGVWGVHPNTNIENVEELEDYPKSEMLISLSPLTDAYKLLKKGKVKEAIVMGGAFNVEGNETKYAEANIAYDPQAAHHFFRACKGVEVKVVPLDVTRKVFWTRAQIDCIPETGKVNCWLKRLLTAWFENYNHAREKDFNLHDPLAVFLTFFPEVATWQQSGVEVVIEGKKRGQSLFNAVNPSCRVAVDLTKPSEVSKKIYEFVFNS